jgi:hypothetical protein
MKNGIMIIVYTINIPMVPYSLQYFFQILLNNINLVKVKTIRPEDEIFNSKLNTSHFGSSQFYLVQYIGLNNVKKGLSKCIFTLIHWIFTLKKYFVTQVYTFKGQLY